MTGIIIIYCISTLAFLLGSLFITRLQQIKEEYLSVSNIIAAIAGLIMIGMFAKELGEIWNNPEDQEHTFFKYRGAYYISLMAFLSGACILTLFKKLRRNTVISLLLVLIYAMSVYFEAFYIIFTSFNSDYLPSSWSYYRPAGYEYLLLLFFVAIFFTVCYLLAKKLKTIYKS